MWNPGWMYVNANGITHLKNIYFSHKVNQKNIHVPKSEKNNMTVISI